MEIFLDSLTLFPLDPGKIVEFAKGAGFDGLEFTDVTNMPSPRRFEEVGKLCMRQGLKYHVRQTRAFRDKLCPSFSAKMAYWLGYMPEFNLGPREQFGDKLGIRQVIFANSWNQAIDRPYRWVETTCPTNELGIPSVSYEEFGTGVLMNNIGIVFDLQNALLYSNDAYDVSQLTENPTELAYQARDLWGILGPATKEIRISNFNPSARSRRRNLGLYKGIFPIIDFAEIVRMTKWSGIIVPAIRPNIFRNFFSSKNPRYLMRYLCFLRDEVEYFFSHSK